VSRPAVTRRPVKQAPAGAAIPRIRPAVLVLEDGEGWPSRAMEFLNGVSATVAWHEDDVVEGSGIFGTR
jgi:hypothetical protein